MTDQAPPDTGASAVDSGMTGVSSSEFWGAFQDSGEQAQAAEQPPEDVKPEAEAEEPQEAEAEESSTEAAEQEESHAKPAKGVQKRLNELTREKHEANRRVQAMEAQLSQAMELLQRMTEGQPQQQPKPVARRQAEVDPDSPNPEDYMVGDQFDALTYQRDLTAHLAKKTVAEEIAAIRREQEQVAMQRAQAQQQAEFQTRTAEAAKAHPDYWDVIEQAKAHPFFNHPVSQMVAMDENGAEIAYELARNPEQMDRLLQLPPQLSLMHLGRISAAIDARRSTPSTAPRVSNAPKPPTPMARASANTDSGYLGRDDIPYERWEAGRNADLKASTRR